MAFTKINAAGIGSTETVTLDGLTVINDGSFGGNVSVGGTLTYEDVTNIDSVGLITARSGVEIGASPGVAASISADGNAIFSGITTVGGNADIEGALVVGNGVAAPLSGFSAHFHADATSNKIQITTSNTGVTASDGAIIMVDSGNNMEILNRENSNIEFFTNNSQSMTLDSSGRLLLGTTTEGYSGADDFTIATSGSTGISLRSASTNAGNLAFSDGSSGDDEHRGLIQYHHSDNTMRFFTDATRRITIDSSGNLGQGTATPTTPDSSNADNSNNGLVFTMYGDSPAINLIHNTSGGSADSTDHAAINFGRTGSSSNPYRAVIAYKQDDDFLRINANNYITFESGGSLGSEKMRLDGSGRLLLGTTTLGESGADELTIENTSADMGITLRTGTDRNASLFFADGTSGSAQYSGYIQYAHNGDYMVLGTNGQETMRMHSDKRISVNTTTKYGTIHSLEDQFSPSDSKWLTDAAYVASGSHGGGYVLLDGSKGYSMYCADNGNDFYIRHHSSTTAGASGGVYLNDAATSWQGASDEREKENLVTISDAITKIKTLRTVTGNYTWQPDVRHAFLIAQDVQAVLPEAVSVVNKDVATEDQSLGLRYTEVIPLLVKAMQEQQEEIESLKARLDAAGL